MRGREVFYPLGWDDNGLPTERRVQNTYGVRCDPSLPYEPDLELTADEHQGRRPAAVSRPNFLELCHRLTAEYEHDFEQQWRSLGLSVDWSLTYATIDDRSRRVAQRAFLRSLARGEVYASEAPTMWDVDFRTAVAQAELEDRPVRGASTGSGSPGGRRTRPRGRDHPPRAAALVRGPGRAPRRRALGAGGRHPGADARVRRRGPGARPPAGGPGQGLRPGHGLHVRRHHRRPVVARPPPAHPLGAAARRALPGGDPAWLEGAGAQAWSALEGRTATQARRAVVELLRETRALVGEPRPVVHDVKFYEKGERPLEIVTSRQWYVRNGAGRRRSGPPCWPAAARSTGTPTSCAAGTSTGSRGSPRTG